MTAPQVFAISCILEDTPRKMEKEQLVITGWMVKPNGHIH